MMKKTIAALLLSLGLIAGTAVAQMEEMAETMGMVESAEPVVLSESDVENWISTVEALLAADLEVMDNPSIPDAMKDLAANSEAMSILDGKGYDMSKFQSHSINIFMAVGAAQMADQREQIETQMAMLDSMREQMPAEQVAMLEAQVKGLMAIFEKTPEENIDTVGKYAAQIEALGE
ncbi:MAG: hypothetical protein AAF578_08600 [Pseudomonadota bacterium]